jgi:hypothetical protein
MAGIGSLCAGMGRTLMHNNALNTVRFAHWTRKSYAFVHLLANR